MSSIRVQSITFVVILFSAVLLSSVELPGWRLGQFAQPYSVGASSRAPALAGYVFSEDVDYVTVAPQSYRISEKKSLFSQLFESAKQNHQFQAFANSRLLQVVAD